MHATIRTYAGDSALADALAARSDDVEAIIASVPGFRAYHLVRTDAGTVSITVCDDAAGCEESTRRAGAYLREHAGEFSSAPADVASGEALISIGTPAAV
jgi:hypothetical protein